MADIQNPYLPSGLDRLSMMLASLGAGISGAESTGRSGWSGLGPAAMMYGGALSQAQQNATAFDQWQQQQQTQEAYRKAQEREMDLKAKGLEMDQQALKAGLDFINGGMGGSTAARPPGMGPPTLPPTMGPGANYYPTLGKSESGNKYDAVNPQSGASGKYQFTPDTWASVATQNPQLGLPFNMKQATDLQQEAAVRALTKSNSQAIGRSDPESLYLAHRFGAAGAQTVLSANPNTPIASLFPPQWSAQNPDMQGVTVGQFRQGVQQRFGAPPMPGAPPDSSRLAPLFMSPRLAPLGGMLRENDKSRFENDWKTYDASEARRRWETEQSDSRRRFDVEQGQKGQWVRGADGIQRWQPASAYTAGTPNYDKPPEPGAPGTETGDYDILTKGNPESREYAAAYNRVKQRFVDLGNGQKLPPDMTAFTAPTFKAPDAAPAPQPLGERNYTETQSKDHTYATRLANAIPQLEEMIRGKDGTYTTERLPGGLRRSLADNPFYPDRWVSEDAKSFRQVINDIQTALLRRESGASIGKHEFTTEVTKFIPQPNDSDKVLKQKMQALKLASRTIAEATGRPLSTYGSAFDVQTAAPAPIRINMGGDRQ